MSDFNVENFNLWYAKACFDVFRAGKIDAPDSMYEKGKEVSESPVWLHYVTKWQTEDVTEYQMEEEEEEEEGTLGAGIAAAGGTAMGSIAGGLEVVTTSTMVAAPEALTASTNGLITEIPQVTQAANSGTLPVAIIYAAFGALFLALTSVMQSKAKKDREQQENYFKESEELMKETFEEEIAEIAVINEEISTYTEEAAELTKTANVKVSAANTAAEATAISAEEVSVAAKSSADEGMSEVISELEAYDEGIIANLPKLDSICKEVDAKKGRFTTLKEEIPDFEKNRKQQIMLMTMLAIGASMGVLSGGIGLGMAWVNFTLAPVAMGIFIAGIALFAASAIVAGVEIPAQKKARTKLNDETTKDVNNGIDKTTKTATEANAVLNKGLINDAAVTQMEEDAAEEDANVNENEVSRSSMLSAMSNAEETESALAA